MKKILFAFVLILNLPGAQAQSSLFWEIEAPNGQKSYLYGTYHLLGADFLTQRPAVQNAYEEAALVMVETLIDSSQLMALSAYTLMPGKSLKGMTDSSDYRMLKEKLEPVMGMDLAVFDMVKPVVLSSSYTMAMMQKLTPDSLQYGGLPMDVYFAENAESKGKDLEQLETMEEQFKILFTGQTEEEQLADLLEMVREEDGGEAMFTNILTAYFNNDLKALYRHSLDWEMDAKDMAVLVDNRNKAWMPKLIKILDAGEAFIAVGALHLPGKNGLIELLRAKGYKLRPIID